MTKIEIDLELLSKEQLVGLVKSLIEKQKKQKPAKVQEIVAEPEVEVRVEKEVVYRTIPTEEPESIKIKKVRGRGKAKRIPLPVRRAVIIADAVNKLQKPVVFRTITDQHTDLFGGHLQGSSYSALKTELQ